MVVFWPRRRHGHPDRPRDRQLPVLQGGPRQSRQKPAKRVNLASFTRFPRVIRSCHLIVIHWSMTVNCWRSMAEGDKGSFLLMYKTYYQALFCYGFSLSVDRELTKDCIQELFVEIWTTRSSLNKDVENVRSYLFTWLRRKISRELSRLAKESAFNEATEDSASIQASYEDLLIAFQQSDEKKEQLRSALSKLTRKQLEIIRLKFFENLSYRAIAERKSITPRTVYNTIYESIRLLRESMKLLLIHLMI